MAGLHNELPGGRTDTTEKKPRGLLLGPAPSPQQFLSQSCLMCYCKGSWYLIYGFPRHTKPRWAALHSSRRGGTEGGRQNCQSPLRTLLIRVNHHSSPLGNRMREQTKRGKEARRTQGTQGMQLSAAAEEVQGRAAFLVHTQNSASNALFQQPDVRPP